MAFVEVEMNSARFNSFVQFMASIGPIPIGMLNGLGGDRLIAQFTWDKVEMGPSFNGFIPQPGTLSGRATVSIRHVSTAELDADPNATGTTTSATAWILVSATAAEFRLDLLAVDIAGSPLQQMAPRIQVNRQPVPNLGSAVPVAAAIFLSNDIVTLRFATKTTDPILSSPLNLLNSTGDSWSIRLSGDFFTESLLTALQNALASPPAGSSVEDAPTAYWGQRNGTWAAIGSVGLEKKDACPGLFGDVDLSLTVDLALTPSANTNVTPEQLNLLLELSGNASDWDTFRCWLGSGGFGASALGIIGSALVGPATGGLGFLVTGIVSLVAIAETVRLDSGREVTGTNIPNFTQTSSSDSSATYTSTINLPVVFQRFSNGTANGRVNSVSSGAFGMLISGEVTFLPAVHVATFTPNGGTLTATFENRYNCGRKTWLRKADLQQILIEDHANIAGQDLGAVPVTIFNSSAAVPANLWSVSKPAPATPQSVTIEGSESVNTGDTARIYLHTSAGIRRFDLPALPALQPPTEQQTIAAVAQCAMKSRLFSPKEKIEWLVDPPPFDFGYPALRQWLLSFADLPAGTNLTVSRIVSEHEKQQLFSTRIAMSGEASFEFMTEAQEELLIEHDGEKLPNGRVLQRWIIPTSITEMGATAQNLLRSGSLIAVDQPDAIFLLDYVTGKQVRQRGQLQLSESGTGGFDIVEQTRKRFRNSLSRSDELVMDVQIEERQQAPPPFSLTLPGGKVAAIFGDKLVIGMPSKTGQVIR